jgi:hypothetical protein
MSFALLAPLIIKGLFMLIEFLAKKNIVSDESKRVFIQMAEELRKIGIANVRSRYEAELQIEAGSSVWDKEESKNNLKNT